MKVLSNLFLLTDICLFILVKMQTVGVWQRSAYALVVNYDIVLLLQTDFCYRDLKCPPLQISLKLVD